MPTGDSQSWYSELWLGPSEFWCPEEAKEKNMWQAITIYLRTMKQLHHLEGQSTAAMPTRQLAIGNAYQQWSSYLQPNNDFKNILEPRT